MELKINIYDNCTSDKPTKTYTIRRILFKTAKELVSLTANKKELDDEQMMLKILQTLIPEFKEEEMQGVDTLEVRQFVKSVGEEINKIVLDAAKN